MKNKIKILHVINSCNPDDGGPIEGIKQFYKQYKKLNIQAEILSSDEKSSFFLKHKDLPKTHAMGKGFLKYNYNYKMFLWLKKNINKYDILIINGLWQYHNYAVWKVSKLYKKPYFIFTHGMLDPWFNQNYPFKYLKKYFYWILIQHKVLKDAKKILFTSKLENKLSSKSFYQKSFKKKTLGYGITGNPYLNSKQNLFLNRFKMLNKKNYLLYLGRITEKKGLDILIQAFNKINNNSLYLVIAGNYKNDYGKKIINFSKNLKNDKIIWVGSLFDKIKWDALRSASLFCLPSHQENFGISVVEALSSKTPVLISNKLNIYREIKECDCGYVNNDNLEGTLKSLNQWIKKTYQKKNNLINNNAYRCFNKYFKIDKIAIKLKNEIKKELNL